MRLGYKWFAVGAGVVLRILSIKPRGEMCESVIDFQSLIAQVKEMSYPRCWSPSPQKGNGIFMLNSLQFQTFIEN